MLQCIRHVTIACDICQKWTRVTIGVAPVQWSTRHKPHPLIFWMEDPLIYSIHVTRNPSTSSYNSSEVSDISRGV